mmetsp:Transcript_34297/g.89077  ORF Transcript_34297/g.89077 Transcript_34297/m.89077 type:complete len:276 (-) Transcript_34297:744-1571(-)
MARAVVITAFLMLLSGGSWWAADVAEGHLGSATVRRISHRAPCASSNLALTTIIQRRRSDSLWGCRPLLLCVQRGLPLLAREKPKAALLWRGHQICGLIGRPGSIASRRRSGRSLRLHVRNFFGGGSFCRLLRSSCFRKVGRQGGVAHYDLIEQERPCYASRKPEDLGLPAGVPARGAHGNEQLEEHGAAIQKEGSHQSNERPHRYGALPENRKYQKREEAKELPGHPAVRSWARHEEDHEATSNTKPEVREAEHHAALHQKQEAQQPQPHKVAD